MKHWTDQFQLCFIALAKLNSYIFIFALGIQSASLQTSGVQTGDERGGGAGHPRQGGIQRAKLQK